MRRGYRWWGGLTHERKVEAGKTYQGVIIIRNGDDTPRQVKVYQTDYLFYSDGKSIYGEPGKTSRSNANWIGYSPSRLTISPKGSKVVHYTIKVPSDKSLRGTYWSMMMVEAIGEGHPEAIEGEKGKAKVGIRNVIRYGMQMVCHIGDSGTRKAKFLQTKLLREKGKRFLQLDVENTGERWLRPSIWADIYNDKGQYIGRFEAGRVRIYPGTSVRRRVDVSALPPGNYKTLIVLDAGGDDVFGATYTLKFKE